jgi:hypothetical protein
MCELPFGNVGLCGGVVSLYTCTNDIRCGGMVESAIRGAVGAVVVQFERGKHWSDCVTESVQD